MEKIIRLLKAESGWAPIYINTNHITFFEPRYKGSAIFVIDYPRAIEVTETPTEILALMEGEDY